MEMIKNSYRNFILFLFFFGLIFLTSTHKAYPSPKSEKGKEICTLSTLSSKPAEFSFVLDEKPQRINVLTHYSFEEKKDRKGNAFILSSKLSSIAFDNFTNAYQNFLKKRVGPSDRCDKLEIGKIQVKVEKNGAVSGYFVGRYVDNWCFFLRFFDARPGDFDRDMYIVSSAKGITGVKNTFRPTLTESGFSLMVESTYEPIEEPSVFGRGEATLKGLYKRPLEGFLSEKEFTSFVNSLLPDNKKKSKDFKLMGIGFMQNNSKKIQLTILSQKKMDKSQACSLSQSILKDKNWTKKAPQDP